MLLYRFPAGTTIVSVIATGPSLCRVPLARRNQPPPSRGAPLSAERSFPFCPTGCFDLTTWQGTSYIIYTFLDLEFSPSSSSMVRVNISHVTGCTHPSIRRPSVRPSVLSRFPTSFFFRGYWYSWCWPKSTATFQQGVFQKSCAGTKAPDVSLTTIAGLNPFQTRNNDFSDSLF